MFTIALIPLENYLKINNSPNKIPILEILKKKIKELRSTDKILYHIIEDENKLTVDKFRAEVLMPEDKDEKINKLGKYKWKIKKEEIKSLLNTKSIFYITERKVHIPIGKSIPLVKGIIKERGFMIEIKKEEFEDDMIEEDEESNIKIKVISSDDERYNILMDECKGKLLIIPLLNQKSMTIN